MEDIEKMRELIKVYKTMPELWNTESVKYKNRIARRKSYGNLLQIYKGIKSDASVKDLKKKIANMRTCYRRELKKISNSERSGAGAGDIYVSSLWYFDDFDFLKDVKFSTASRSNLDTDEEVDSFRQTPKKKNASKSAASTRMGLLKTATEHLNPSNNKDEDEAAVYGSSWACMFRKMNADQQLYAKQAVDEIMLLGQLGKLSLNYLKTKSALSSYSTPISTLSRANTPFNNMAVNTPVTYITEMATPPQLDGYTDINDSLTDPEFQ